MRSRISFLLLASVAIVGCSTDMVAPPRAASNTATPSNAAQKAGKYLVLMSTPSIPAGFAQKVQRLGGKVRISHSGAGFALVSGLTDAGAAELATTIGVAAVQADIPVALKLPTAKITLDVADVASSHGVVTGPAAALHFDWQWNMSLIEADKAWAAGKLGSQNVTAAIIDTGIDYDGLDLNGHVDLARSKSFVGADTGDPTEDNLLEHFFPGRNRISDMNGHGTNVASQVVSNAVTFAGVSSRTTLIGVKVLGADGSGTFGAVLGGILFAADQGADVANLSVGVTFSRSEPGAKGAIRFINAVFDYARKKGTLLVVAAGNDAEDLDNNGDTFAGYCDAVHVICVSAVGPETPRGNGDIPAFYTNFGALSIDVAAPGGNANIVKPRVSRWPWGKDIISWVWSRCSRQELAFDAAGNASPDGCGTAFNLSGFIGTSQATPHVAGLAALLVAEKGRGDPGKIKRLIESTGDPINPLYGKGRINVRTALGLH